MTSCALLSLVSAARATDAPPAPAPGADLSAATMLLNLNLSTGSEVSASSAAAKSTTEFGSNENMTFSAGMTATYAARRGVSKSCRHSTRTKPRGPTRDDEDEISAKRIKRDAIPWVPAPLPVTIVPSGTTSPESPPQAQVGKRLTASTPPGHAASLPSHASTVGDKSLGLLPIPAPSAAAPAPAALSAGPAGPQWNSLVSAEGKVRDMRKKPQPPSLESSLACVPTPVSKNRVPRKKILWRAPNKL